MSSIESTEAQITELLCNYMVASGLYKTFKSYRDKTGRIDPLIKENNVVYVTHFREGFLVTEFLREQKNTFSDETSQKMIDLMINNWQKLVNYCLMLIDEKIKKQKKAEQ